MKTILPSDVQSRNPFNSEVPSHEARVISKDAVTCWHNLMLTNGAAMTA